MFTIGQRVICVDDKDIDPIFPQLKEGETYTVAGFSSYNGVQLLETPVPEKGSYYGYFPKRFAPKVARWSDVTHELAAQSAVEETSDMPVKQIVNSN